MARIGLENSLTLRAESTIQLDFVRLEIAYALEGGIPVIPLLINTTQMPKPEMLPPDIQELAFRHALPLDSGMDFHSHADRLIAGIGKATDAARKRRRFVTDSEKTRPASPTTHVQRTSFGGEESKRKLIAWTGSKLVVGTSVALLFAVAALAAWYVATYRREPAKQVATANESKSDKSAQPFSESAPTVKPSVPISPSAEASSPLPLASVKPKPVVGPNSQPQITKAARLDFASITKEHPYVNSLGMKFVPVPGTSVLFSIWETRVKDFEAFVEASGHKAEGGMLSMEKGIKDVGGTWRDPGFSQTGEHSVCGVSWEDATAFCEWLTEQERKAGRISANQAYRLPTDLEWNAAVGKIKYPWGTQWPPPNGAGNYNQHFKVDEYETTSPVGSFEANSYGIYDLGGNLSEWIDSTGLPSDEQKEALRWDTKQDWYDAMKTMGEMRGGSWAILFPDHLLSSYRRFNLREARSDDVGFRCVLSELEIVSTKDEESSAPLESPSTSPNDSGAQKLTKIYVKKYGFSVLLPTEFFPDAALQLADANTDRLVSVNGCFRVAFNVLSGPVKKAYDNCIAEFRKKANHTTIDYKVVKETWFVVSGDSGTTGYYTKGVKRGEDIFVMQLEYTGDICNITDAMLTEMSHKFDGK